MTSITRSARRPAGGRKSVARKKNKNKQSKAKAVSRVRLETSVLRSTLTAQVAATGIQDKSIAVANSIDDQLTADGRVPDNDKVMADDYQYTLQTISTFLRGVKTRLAANDPRFSFEFDTAFARAALADSVAELTGDVDAKTT